MNSVKLYVGNLPPNVCDTELQKMFEGAGPVQHIAIMFDGLPGTNGHAVVEMMRASDASLAIEYLDGAQLDGNELVVSYLTSQVKGAKQSALGHVLSAKQNLDEHHYPKS